MIRRYYHYILLMSSKDLTFWERVNFWLKSVLASAPIVMVLDAWHAWFNTNLIFFLFMLGTIMINAGVGVWYHWKVNTFSWRDFSNKNFILAASVIMVYALLEMISIIAGDNLVGETFRVFVQITVLMYPISKTLKNIYLLNNKNFPPKFLMDKVYRFETEGPEVLKQMFDKEKQQENNELNDNQNN